LTIDGCNKQSTIGDGNIIGAKCRIVNSTIGNGCMLSPGVVLENAEIPDDTSVYLFQGSWRSKPVDISIMEPVLDAYREKIIAENAPAIEASPAPASTEE
jgi:NDP-sugar pyrophosphorylase family protein